MSPSISRRTAVCAALAGAAGLLAAPTASAAVPTAKATDPTATDDLAFPRTPLARAATRLVTESEDAFLRNHSFRSFLFARELAGRAGLAPDVDYDVELVFLICALHDIGLTDLANTNQRFEFDGADYAALFLERQGVTDHRVDTVWDAIAMHTTRAFRDSPVFRRRRPPEIAIAHDGISTDIFGFTPIPPEYAERVHSRYPRLGGSRAVTDAIEAKALANPLKAPAMSLPGEILHQRHPELPYTTWDQLLDRNAWGD